MNQIIVVSNAAEQSAVRQILGADTRIVAWDAKPDMSQFQDQQVLIWFNKEPAYRDVVDLAARSILKRTRTVNEIDVYDDVMGKTPQEAAAEGLTAETFTSWSKTLSRGCKGGEFRETEADEPIGEFLDAGEQSQHWTTLGLAMTGGKNPQPLPNADNVLRILEKVDRLVGVIWLDDFSGMTMITLDGETRQWTDEDTRMLWIELQRKMGMGNLGKDAVFEAVMACGRINRRHPVKEWLEPIVWDGKPRLGGFFRDYMGAGDSAFNRAVSKNFFISMIARIYKPGCKVDHMIILEGKQGARKSSALRAIAGDWFTECNEPLGGNNKDFYGVLHGKMLIEIAELDSFSKAETTKIKAIISTPTDRYRQPYGRITQEHPRTFVFVGTTNIDHYLGDSTGGRRFLPMPIGHIDLEKITQDRDQLFAEAAALYRNGASWWEVPQDEAEALQESRRKVEVWEAPIAEFLRGKPSATSEEIFGKQCLNIEVEKRTNQMSRNVASCMRALGWEQKFRRVDGRGHRVWLRVSYDTASDFPIRDMKH